MTAWNTIAAPCARRSEVTAALVEHLEAGGPYREVRPDHEHIRGKDLRLLDLDLEAGPPSTLACYERSVPGDSGDGRPAVFVELDGRLDLPLAAAVSRATGGFTLAVESWRARGRAALALFWAGAVIEARALDREGGRGLGDLDAPFDVDQEYRAILAAALGIDAQLVYPRTWTKDDTVVDVIRCGRRAPKEAHELPLPTTARCAFFGLPPGEDLHARDRQEGDRVQRVIPTTDGLLLGALPGVGPGDAPRTLRRHRRLACPALALSARTSGETRWWSAVPGAEPKAGTAPTGQTLLRLLNAFGLLTGARAGDLRIPR